jgi:hypothetical protein
MGWWVDGLWRVVSVGVGGGGGDDGEIGRLGGRVG